MTIQIIAAIEHYRQHETEIRTTIDGLVEGVTPLPGDEPAYAFGALVVALAEDRDRAVTIAAAALMRLAEIEAAGGAA